MSWLLALTAANLIISTTVLLVLVRRKGPVKCELTDLDKKWRRPFRDANGPTKGGAAGSVERLVPLRRARGRDADGRGRWRAVG